MTTLDWTLFAILSAVTFGIVSVLDKLLLSVNIRVIQAYYAWLGIALLANSIVVYIIFGMQEQWIFSTTMIAYGAGLSWGMALVLSFYAIKYEEISRATAIYQTFPIFVAIFAVIFLGETIGIGRGIAIGTIVVGAYLISIKGITIAQALRPTKYLPILVLASLMVGIGHFGGKVALEDYSVPTAYIIRSLGMATSLLVFFRPKVTKEMIRNFKDAQTRYLVFLVFFILSPAAVAFALIATNIGPVSLVSSVVATRPMFVFLFATILSKTRLHFMGEPLKRDTFLLKGFSITLVVGGLVILHVM